MSKDLDAAMMFFNMINEAEKHAKKLPPQPKTYDGEFGPIRAYKYNGTVWYSVADICRALGIQNPTVAVKNINTENKILLPVNGSMNGLNEEGVYMLALRSYKKDAIPFIRWFAATVDEKRQRIKTEFDKLRDQIDRLQSEVLE